MKSWTLLRASYFYSLLEFCAILMLNYNLCKWEGLIWDFQGGCDNCLQVLQVEQILSVRPQIRTVTLVDGDRVAEQQTQLRKRKVLLKSQSGPTAKEAALWNGEFMSLIHSICTWWEALRTQNWTQQLKGLTHRPIKQREHCVLNTSIKGTGAAGKEI